MVPSGRAASRTFQSEAAGEWSSGKPARVAGRGEEAIPSPGGTVAMLP